MCVCVHAYVCMLTYMDLYTTVQVPYLLSSLLVVTWTSSTVSLFLTMLWSSVTLVSLGLEEEGAKVKGQPHKTGAKVKGQPHKTVANPYVLAGFSDVPQVVHICEFIAGHLKTEIMMRSTAVEPLFSGHQ